MRFSILLVIAGSTVSSLKAQQLSVPPSPVSQPQISTTATATRSIPPDLAIAHFEFFARDSTLTAAARGAAAIGTAIRRAVVKLGIPDDSILGRGSVAYTWDQATLMEVKPNAEFKRYDTTYVFRDMLVVRIRDLKRVGPVLDGGLAAGAALQYSSSRVQQAGKDALAEATRQARRNAELMAEAGGGRVGRPLVLTTQNSSSGESFYELRPTNSSCTNSNHCGLKASPPDGEIRVSVYGRWELLSASDSVPP